MVTYSIPGMLGSAVVVVVGQAIVAVAAGMVVNGWMGGWRENGKRWRRRLNQSITARIETQDKNKGPGRKRPEENRA